MQAKGTKEAVARDKTKNSFVDNPANGTNEAPVHLDLHNLTGGNVSTNTMTTTAAAATTTTTKTKTMMMMMMMIGNSWDDC